MRFAALIFTATAIHIQQTNLELIKKALRAWRFCNPSKGVKAITSKQATACAQNAGASGKDLKKAQKLFKLAAGKDGLLSKVDLANAVKKVMEWKD